MFVQMESFIRAKNEGATDDEADKAAGIDRAALNERSRRRII
jgi:hypothetical protein